MWKFDLTLSIDNEYCVFVLINTMKNNILFTWDPVSEWGSGIKILFWRLTTQSEIERPFEGTWKAKTLFIIFCYFNLVFFKLHWQFLPSFIPSVVSTPLNLARLKLWNLRYPNHFPLTLRSWESPWFADQEIKTSDTNFGFFENKT